jgi:hypothetical protein
VSPYPSRIPIPVRSSQARNTSVGMGAAPHAPSSTVDTSREPTGTCSSDAYTVGTALKNVTRCCSTMSQNRPSSPGVR